MRVLNLPQHMIIQHEVAVLASSISQRPRIFSHFEPIEIAATSIFNRVQLVPPVLSAWLSYLMLL